MKLLTIQAAVITALFLMAGCSKTSIGSGPGTLSINIAHDPSTTTVTAQSKAGTPDAADFTVDIMKSGSVHKRYSPVGASSKNITLEAGNYSIVVYSKEFTAPAFENPVYGASKDFTITEGGSEEVNLTCTQTNAGITVIYSNDFKAAYTNYSTLVTHTSGSLHFTGTNADKLGHFPSGTVDIEITADSKTYSSTLTLSPKTNYSITVDKSPAESGEELAVTISVVTTVDEEDVTIYFPEEGNSGGTGQREVIYFENFGDNELIKKTGIESYAGWKATGVVYTGEQIDILNNCLADYEGSSKGNYGEMQGIGSTMSITGIDCSGYRNLILTIGTHTNNGNFDMSKFKVYIVKDGTPTLLNYERSTAGAWEKLSVTLPADDEISLRIDGVVGYYYFDDIEISGIAN